MTRLLVVLTWGTFAVTVTSVGESRASPSPPTSSTGGENVLPSASGSRSTSSRSPSRTVYCLPPTEMIA